MSSLEAFKQRVEADQALQAKVLAASAFSDFLERYVVLGRLHGFEFGGNEVQAAIETAKRIQRSRVYGEPLTREELAATAGLPAATNSGTSNYTCC